MNNTPTILYYVTVDENNYVLSASSQEDESKIKVYIPLSSIEDFQLHMSLYKVYSNGEIDFPDFKASTLADQITTLQNLATQSTQNLNKANNDLQNANKIIVSLTQEIASLKASK